MMLGKNIYRLRKQKKMTQEQLAEAAGIGQKQVSKIESGRVHAKLTTYLCIANALSVTLDHLLVDALFIEPEHQSLSKLSGAKEQELLREIIHATIHYLNNKKT